MTANDKPLLSIVELQEQLAFFQQRCIVLRGEVEKREGRAMIAFGVIAATFQEQPNQGITIAGQGLIAERVSGLRQPVEHCHAAGGRIQTDTIGQSAVSRGVVG